MFEILLMVFWVAILSLVGISLFGFIAYWLILHYGTKYRWGEYKDDEEGI